MNICYMLTCWGLQGICILSISLNISISNLAFTILLWFSVGGASTCREPPPLVYSSRCESSFDLIWFHISVCMHSTRTSLKTFKKKLNRTSSSFHWHMKNICSINLLSRFEWSHNTVWYSKYGKRVLIDFQNIESFTKTRHGSHPHKVSTSCSSLGTTSAIFQGCHKTLLKCSSC